MNISFFTFFALFVNVSKVICYNSLNPNRTNLTNRLLSSSKYITKNDEYLKNVEYSDIKRFIPPIEEGKVVKVYDGDTITIASKLPNSNLPFYRFSVRLRSIDSPEIKGITEEEKSLAIEARDALHNLIFGKIIVLKNLGTEKYGRVLADIYLEELHINKWMLDNKYAVPYDGKKKVRPVEWDESRLYIP
uniref:TNase-like domain-containing protein n=1 Tax=viral metagenome TaxID=1070528 RepID=A0A6C0JH47_9ZZZZ